LEPFAMKLSPHDGFSLLEMLIAAGLVMVLAAFVVNLSSRDGAGEIVVRDAARRLRLRRAESIRLSAGLGADAVERSAWQPSVTLDFADPPTTAALRLGNCADAAVTRIRCPAGEPSPSCYCLDADQKPEPAVAWDYRYQGGEMRLPAGWAVARAAKDLPPGVPELPNSQLTTLVSFATAGQVSPVDTKTPPPAQEVPAKVWAIYFTDGEETVRALTVNESGFVEIWRWQPRGGDGGGDWQGFGNRSCDEL
jgi:hypothetical protein